MLKSLFKLLIIFTCYAHTNAQGVRGTIYDENGQPLPFASIYVAQSGKGTSTNADAYYELRLPSGTHSIEYKFIGYESVTKEVKLTNSFVQLDIYLSPQTQLLSEVTTSAKATDPANWMMRRAIAKSSYHRQLIDGYRARVYVKGKGRVTKIPFYLRSALKSEGIDTTTLIITESVSEISYRRPNQFKEKVISIYASKETDFNANPMPYIAGSFYQEEIGESISPLSRNAFKYYNFKHVGAFMDGGHLINKIRVTPKVKAPNVFEGIIELVEEDWALYSVDLSTQIDFGIELRIKQLYEAIDEAAWMPITHHLVADGKLMGVSFKFDYLASVSNYQITLNPAFPKNIVIADESNSKKAENKPADAQVKSIEALKNQSTKQKTVTIEELPGLIKQFEKNETDSLEKIEVLGIYDFKIDSMAFNQDSLFWKKVRPIPLSLNERRGYTKIDSVSLLMEEDGKKDSVKNSKRGTFQITDLLFGGRYKLDSAGKNQFIIYNALLSTQFNTVEGLNVDYSIGYRRNFKPDWDNFDRAQKDYTYYSAPYFLLKPTLRFAAARNLFTGKLLAKYRFSTGSIGVSGGRYISQFNTLPALNPLINTSFTLMWEQNFMKLYEKDFVEIAFDKRFSSSLDISAVLNYEQRYTLRNNSDYSFIDWKREFTPNVPFHNDFVVDFNNQRALTFSAKLTYRPNVKYIIRNGIRNPVFTDAAEWSIEYFKGINTIFGSEVNFDRVEVAYNNSYDFGLKGTIFYNVRAGGFLNNRALGFMDFAHFPGNRSFVTQADPVESFRLLDYYLYSTDTYYLQTFLFHRFRKLALTQIPAARLLGLREGVFVNYLLTENSNNYTELGYSLEGILNFFRVEVAANFENLQYQGWGIRVGISTKLGSSIQVEVNDE